MLVFSKMLYALCVSITLMHTLILTPAVVGRVLAVPVTFSGYSIATNWLKKYTGM